MAKLFHIAYEEIMVHLKEWTFYLTAIGMPLVFAAIGLLPQIRAIAQESPLSRMETVFSESETVTELTGYVDHAGIITMLPADQADQLRPFAAEAAAAEALAQGEIEAGSGGGQYLAYHRPDCPPRPACGGRGPPLAACPRASDYVGG